MNLLRVVSVSTFINDQQNHESHLCVFTLFVKWYRRENLPEMCKIQSFSMLVGLNNYYVMKL